MFYAFYLGKSEMPFNLSSLKFRHCIATYDISTFLADRAGDIQCASSQSYREYCSQFIIFALKSNRHAHTATLQHPRIVISHTNANSFTHSQTKTYSRTHTHTYKQKTQTEPFTMYIVYIPSSITAALSSAIPVETFHIFTS